MLSQSDSISPDSISPLDRVGADMEALPRPAVQDVSDC